MSSSAPGHAAGTPPAPAPVVPPGRSVRDAVPSTDGTPRERLLHAAREVVADDGLEGLTLRAIARRAGVSHGAPLRHFPTLASLLAAVAADGFTRLITAVETYLAAADAAARAAGTTVDPRQRVAIAARAYVDTALADPGVFSVTFRPERVDVTDAAYQLHGFASFQQLVDLVEAAQADGWQPDQPSRDLAAVLWAHVHGLAVLAVHGALPTVVGDGAMARLTSLSALMTLGTEPVPVPDPTPGPPAPTGTDHDTDTDTDTDIDTDHAAPAREGDPR